MSGHIDAIDVIGQRPDIWGREDLEDALRGLRGNTARGGLLGEVDFEGEVGTELDEPSPSDQSVELSRPQFDDLISRRTQIDQDKNRGKISYNEWLRQTANLYADFGVPFDPDTLTGPSDSFGLISTRIRVVDSEDSGGGSVINDQGSSQPGGGGTMGETPEAEESGGGGTPPASDGGLSTFDREHPWEYNSDTGTMTDITTGNIVTIPADKRGLFEDGGRYSAGDGRISNESGQQVAGFDTEEDARGEIITFRIWGAEGPDGAFDGGGIQGPQPGQSSGSGGGSGGGTGTGTGGGTGDGTGGGGDSSGDGSGGGGDGGGGGYVGGGGGGGAGGGEGPGTGELPGLFGKRLTRGSMTPFLFDRSDLDLDNIPQGLFQINRNFRRIR